MLVCETVEGWNKLALLGWAKGELVFISTEMSYFTLAFDLDFMIGLEYWLLLELVESRRLFRYDFWGKGFTPV